MVAPRRTIAECFMPLPEEVLQGRWLLPRMTRGAVEALVRSGDVPEDASMELLNGMIVLKDRSAVDQDPRLVGKGHTKCVERLSNLRASINSAARHVRAQQPLVCTDTHVPEPDFMVLRGTLDDYDDLPTAADVFCVVEVADSSYERDAGDKLRGYARAGVAQYVIINLRNRTAEVYVNPDVNAGAYPSPTIVTPDQTLMLRVRPEDYFPVPLADVLP